jgi:hypothetical protein
MEHSDDEVTAMRESLRRFGQVGALVINRRHSPPVVVGGNKRLQAILAEGWQTCAVMDVDLPDDEAAALVLTLNATQGVRYVPESLGKMLTRMGSVNIGENMDGVLAKLAEAHKLIPKTAGAGAGTSPGKDDSPSVHTVTLQYGDADEQILKDFIGQEGPEPLDTKRAGKHILQRIKDVVRDAQEAREFAP